MRRIILLILLLHISSFSLFAQGDAPERRGWSRDFPPLYGDVQSVTISEYIAKMESNEIVKEMLLTKEVYTLNKKGNVVGRELQVANRDGIRVCEREESERRECRYDAKGNVIQEVLYDSVEIAISAPVSDKAPRMVGDSDVQMNELEGATINSIDEAVQGRVAGVEVRSMNEANVRSSTLRIRGTRSIGGTDAPLIVVDGVVEAVASLDEIDPSDVKSVSVLKDASLTAEYGPRGANGVILVKTHSGESGGSKTSGQRVVKKSVVIYVTEYEIVYR